MNYGQSFVTLYRRQGSRPSPWKRNARKQNGYLRPYKDTKSKGEKERYSHLNAEFQRIARRDKKAFLSDQWKEIQENNRMGKTRDRLKKIRDTKGTFHAKLTGLHEKDKKFCFWIKSICFLVSKPKPLSPLLKINHAFYFSKLWSGLKPNDYKIFMKQCIPSSK